MSFYPILCHRERSASFENPADILPSSCSNGRSGGHLCGGLETEGGGNVQRGPGWEHVQRQLFNRSRRYKSDMSNGKIWESMPMAMFSEVPSSMPMSMPIPLFGGLSMAMSMAILFQVPYQCQCQWQCLMLCLNVNSNANVLPHF